MASENPSLKFHSIYLGVIVILLLGLGGVWYHYHHEIEALRAQKASMMGMRHMGGMGGMTMAFATPAPLTAEQKQQLVAGTDTSTTKKTFTIDGGNFYFSPNKITVNKGDTVTITFKNDGGFHDFVIDVLHIKTPIIKTGETAVVTFTAVTSGTYQFYCSLPGHKAKGMVGTLVIQ